MHSLAAKITYASEPRRPAVPFSPRPLAPFLNITTKGKGKEKEKGRKREQKGRQKGKGRERGGKIENNRGGNTHPARPQDPERSPAKDLVFVVGERKKKKGEEER